MTSSEFPGSLKLSVGMRVDHRGESWQVTHLDGMEVRLAHVSGRTETLPFHRFVDLPSVRRLAERHQADQQGTINSHLDAMFDSLPEELKQEALTRLAHLHEAVTGFCSGNPDRAKPDEPRAEYDPARHVEAARFRAKAKELSTQGAKISARTLRFQRDEYQLRGLLALVDGRKLRKGLPLGRHPVEVIQAAKAVISEATNASTVTKKKHVGDVRRTLKADMATGKVQLQKGIPSYSGIVRLLNKLSVNQYTYDSAKLRRSIAGRPQRMYQTLIPTRVGEYVIIDASTYDVWGFDSITGKKVRHRLVVAIDVFSRCILSARFFENDPKGIDVTFMLHDIIAPKVAPPGWPEQGLLPYLGIPEALVLELHGLDPDTRLKGLPFARPDNLTIDNGKIFVSKVFESACERLGISLIVARPYTGNDKGHVERFFETARDNFCVHLPGYTGNNPMNRGADPEANAFYFRSELEAEFHLWLTRVYHVRQHSGLQEHEVPAVEHTPLEKFRAGISASGYLHVPGDQDLYQQLLETVWRKIHAYGVECYGIYYDAPEMMPLRNAACPYSLKNGGKWPFKVDPRDLRYLHFRLPDSGSWIRLTRRDARFADVPFTAVHLELARASVNAAGGKERSHRAVSDALEELLADQRTQVAQNTAQRRREVKALHQFERAQADQGQIDQQQAASRAMDVAEAFRNTDTPEVTLQPGEGFGNVDELDVNVANVFARGATSFWNSNEEEE